MKKLKILAISDHGTSGIAESLRLPLRHWHDSGHEISQLALGYNGWQTTIDKEMCPWGERLMPIYGGDAENRFGASVIDGALEVVKPDFVITAFDVWMINYLSQPSKFRLKESVTNLIDHGKRRFKHIAYFPLDGAVQDKYLPLGMDEAIAGFDIPVTYSRYAQNIVQQNTGLEIPFIPIAHDKKYYYPGDKRAAKENFGWDPDSFIIGMVATNQYRKAWGEFFEAVVPLAQQYKDILILPWTTWDQKIAGGAEIQDFVWRSGLAPKGQIINPAEGIGKINDAGMGQLYRAMDVCVLTTIGEGAGLPPLRARACGTPALVSANTSNIEFCGSEFEAVPVNGSYYDPFGSNLQRFTTNTRELHNRIEHLYCNPDAYKLTSKRGIREMEKYEKDVVMPQWDELLEGAI